MRIATALLVVTALAAPTLAAPTTEDGWLAGLTDRVKFLGFVPQNELKSFYSECSVVTISSVWPEPFATIGMEVMRYGIPVVAFDAGGIKDWLQDGYNGFLVPWMECKEYARRLDQLLRDKVLARAMGERGRTLVNDRYSFPDYISDLESMFQRVTEEKKGRTPPKPAAPSTVSAGAA